MDYFRWTTHAIHGSPSTTLPVLGWACSRRRCVNTLKPLRNQHCLLYQHLGGTNPGLDLLIPTPVIQATRPLALLVHILVPLPLLAAVVANTDVGDHLVRTTDHAQKTRDRDTVDLAPQLPSQGIHVTEVTQNLILRRQDRSIRVGEVTQDLDPQLPDPDIHVQGATTLDPHAEEVILHLDRRLQPHDRGGTRTPIAGPTAQNIDKFHLILERNPKRTRGGSINARGKR